MKEDTAPTAAPVVVIQGIDLWADMILTGGVCGKLVVPCSSEETWDGEVDVTDQAWPIPIPPGRDHSGRDRQVIAAPGCEAGVYGYATPQKRHGHRDATEVFVCIRGGTTIWVEGADPEMIELGQSKCDDGDMPDILLVRSGFLHEVVETSDDAIVLVCKLGESTPDDIYFE